MSEKKARLSRLLWVLPTASVLAAAAGIATAKPAPTHRVAPSSGSDDRFLMARDAFRLGERVRLAKAAEGLSGHDLEPWARYWVLRLRIEDADAVDGPVGAQVAEFLGRHPGSYLAERLRTDWLRALGRRQQWEIFAAEYPNLVQPETDLVCYRLQYRLAAQDAKAYDEARAVWSGATELPDACVPVMEALAGADRLSAEDVWDRIRRQLEAKKLGQARFAGQFLPAAQRPDGRAMELAADQPARFLERQSSAAAGRGQREIVLFAVQRLARQDVEAARDQWRRIEARFPDAERAYGWALLGWQGAQRHHPEAFAWYEKAGSLALSEEMQAWRVRAALRNQDWAGVRRSIEQMAASQSAEPTWTYWYGRALAAQGHREEARALYQRIAGQASFYGNLADEEMGRAISVPPRAMPPTRDETAAAAATPGLRRALALFRLDMRVEAVREWNFTLRGMDDRQLLAAAELARSQDIYDRTINTADRTQAQHDFGLRYLAPFRDKVEPKARELALDNGWVYGLMRQESRFILQAKSSAGAQGLMQLMPATAKWVARKIGLAGFQPGRVTDMDTNVTLGTHYMKMVLESLDNHPVLASAAYNAGPGRARKWRAARPLEGAIYAETIPFNETRDYVKKVMSNAVYYAALFEERPQSLKTRLGIIQPGRGGEPGEDLP